MGKDSPHSKGVTLATELKLLVDMVTVLGAASVCGYLASRLKQPVLLGYLAGGVVVGPAGFGLINGESDIGLGIEMGAFVAGLMISEVEYADQALDRVLPMRDVFATLFFASIGTLIDPGFLWTNAPTATRRSTLSTSSVPAKLFNPSSSPPWPSDPTCSSASAASSRRFNRRSITPGTGPGACE